MSQGHILRDQIKEPITSNRPKEITDMRSPVKFVAVVSFFFFFLKGEKEKKESILAMTRENPSVEDQFKFKEPTSCLSSFEVLEESWAV